MLNDPFCKVYQLPIVILHSNFSTIPYDKIRKEKPRISEQEAWKRTCEGTGYEYLLDNSWGKPLTAWTNAELQWAVDRLYKMDHSTYDYHVVDHIHHKHNP